MSFLRAAQLVLPALAAGMSYSFWRISEREGDVGLASDWTFITGWFAAWTFLSLLDLATTALARHRAEESR